MYSPRDDVLFSEKEYTYDYLMQINVCRLCLKQNATIQILKSFKTIKKSINIRNSFRDIVKDCFGLELSPEQRPNKVCTLCFNQVHEYFKFRTICLRNEKKLKEILTQHEKKQNEITECVMTEKVSQEFDKNQLEKAIPNIENIIENFDKKEQLIIETEILKELKFEFKKETSDLSETDHEVTLKTEEQLIMYQPKKNKKLKTLSLQKNKIKEYSQFKKSKTKRSSQTYCNICMDEFKNKEIFNKHNLEIHSLTEDGLFKCLGCSKIFKTRNTCIAHEDKFCKQLENGYKCSDCDRYLPNRKLYERHRIDHQNNTITNLPNDMFCCNKCSETFDTKNALKSHSTLMHPVELVCEECGRKFTRPDYLYQHMKIHSGNKMYSCSKCDYRCVQKSSLNIHMRRHTGERPHRCTICGHGSVNSSALYRHLETHSDLKRFQCEVCTKQFRHKTTLLEHIASEHEHSASYPCTMCGSVYSRKRGLRRHIMAKHGGKLAVNVNINVKDNGGPDCNTENIHGIGEVDLDKNVNENK